MKSKIIFQFICISFIGVAITNNTIAQKQLNANKPNQTPKQIHSVQPPTYTYKVFQAPNTMFGYDIYQNGKGVFHQPAVLISPNMMPANQQTAQQNANTTTDSHATVNGFSQREYAENAARLSIEKIEKRSGPALTDDEMKQVIRNVKPSQTIKN